MMGSPFLRRKKSREKMRHYIGLCLLLASSAVSQDAPMLLRDRIIQEGLKNADAADREIWERREKERDARLREIYKDPETLKESLRANFGMDQFLWEWEIPIFKEKYGVADDALRTALMGIYREFEHLGGEPFLKGDPRELTEDKRRLNTSIEWLGYCADDSVKRLLLGIANDDTKAECYRIFAINASLQCADAQQVRDVILRFIVEVKINPYSAWVNAMGVYDQTKDDPQKREAILATLIVLLAKEENKDRFGERDKYLAKRSKEYATSSQRLAMVQRMSKLPPSQHRDTDHDLNAALKSFRFRLFKTNVSTNMTELMARDFSKPAEVKKK